MQSTAKQFNANLTLTFDEFKDKTLEIAKKKLGSKSNYLETDDLTLGYNWGPAKDSLKTPPATGLEDEEDYEGTPFRCWHSSRVYIERLGFIVTARTSSLRGFHRYPGFIATRTSLLRGLHRYADFIVIRTSLLRRLNSNANTVPFTCKSRS